jgi:hypothetical protein
MTQENILSHYYIHWWLNICMTRKTLNAWQESLEMILRINYKIVYSLEIRDPQLAKFFQIHMQQFKEVSKLLNPYRKSIPVSSYFSSLYLRSLT